MILEDRRAVAAARGMAVVCAYERSRGAALYECSRGYDNTLRATLRDLGCEVPAPPSADVISTVSDSVRIIEVKSRGGYGDIANVPERELETMRAGGEHAWLYIVYNVTQRGPYELWVVQDPGHRLPWTLTREAERPPGSYRGVRHEARYATSMSAVDAAGTQVDIGGLENLPSKAEYAPEPI